MQYVFGLGEYHFIRLINPYVNLIDIEVNNCIKYNWNVHKNCK